MISNKQTSLLFLMIWIVCGMEENNANGNLDVKEQSEKLGDILPVDKNFDDIVAVFDEEPQIDRSQLAQLHQIWKPSLVWLVTQIAIFSAYFLVKDWSKIFFPWAQALNVIPFIPASISPFVRASGKLLMIATFFTMFSATFTYHTVFQFLLADFEFCSVIIWFWLSAIFGAYIANTFQTREIDAVRSKKIEIGIYILWFLVELMVLLGRFLIPTWAKWFLWMQYLQIVSLVFNVSSTLAPLTEARQNCVFGFFLSLVVFVLSYHSITFLSVLGAHLSKEIPAWYIVIHLWSWPWIYLVTLGMFQVQHRQSQISWIHYVFYYFLWLLLEVAIIFARIYVPAWKYFFHFAQGFQATSLFQIPFIQGSRSASISISITILLSYYSVMPYILSGWPLFHVLFWPWIGLFLVFAAFDELLVDAANAVISCVFSIV